ncbi:MAG: hypothetical protein U0L12_06705 [Ruminococcus sp.]|nr:hypothetical protein [Ruminococcus sp.]
MSDVASLRAELSRQQRINSELRSELYELERGVYSAEREMSNFRDNVMGSLNNSAQKINDSHNRILQAYEVQGEIDKMYVCFKQMELANKKIRECNNKKYYEFGNYRTVRKLVQGMMDNMDLQMVSDDIIYKSIEKQHLQTPDYWLTCVLISVMAWKNDDRELADHAMARALELEKKDAAIFYMLFNIRIGREEAALKWFDVYQECELKGSDEKTFLLLFSLLNKTIDEQVEDHTKYEIYSFINKVMALNARAKGFSEEEIINLIKGYLTSMRKDDTLELNLLKRCCNDYLKIADMVCLAENNKQILQFILDVGNVSEMERNAYVTKFIESEISKPNSEELAVYNEIEYNELVIRCNGEVEMAKRLYQEEQERRAKELNLIKEMIQWVYGPVSDEVDPQSRKNMFLLTGAIQKKSIRKYAEDYRSMEQSQHPITLGEYQTTANFNNLEGEKQKVQAHYEAEKEQKLSAIKDWPAFVGFGLGAAAAVASFFVSFALLFGTAIGVGFGVFKLISNKKQREQAARDCQLNINGKWDLLTKLFGEYEQMKQIFAEYDSYQERIMDALEQMA